MSLDNDVSMTQSVLPIKTCVGASRWVPLIVIVSPLLPIAGAMLVVMGVLELEYV